MLDLKKYYGEMKKLTIAELVLNAVTFFCVLFLFVLPCFTASIGRVFRGEGYGVRGFLEDETSDIRLPVEDGTPAGRGGEI